MTGGDILQDFLEFVIVFSVGGMMVASIKRIRRGQVSVPRCNECNAAISRTYEKCPYCRASQLQDA